MNLKFKIGQFIVIKWHPVEDMMPTPLGVMYSEAKKAKWGVWRIDPYKPDYFNDINYKMHLVPVGESAKYFLPMDRYTMDYTGPFGVSDEMIFDDQALAEKFVAEFLID